MSMPEPNEIKNLRENAQIELSELAKITSLSIPQLKQLEEGGDHLFYSKDIKQQAIKRVLKVIDPDRAVDSESAESTHSNHIHQSKEPGSSKNVIEEIVRLSNKGGRSKGISTPPIYTRKNINPMTWGAGVIFIGIAVLYLSPWDSTTTTSTEIVTPNLKDQGSLPSTADTAVLSQTPATTVEITTPLSNPLTDSKNALMSSAKTTVDTSLNAVSTTLTRAQDVVKGSTTPESAVAPASASIPGVAAMGTQTPATKPKETDSNSSSTTGTAALTAGGDPCQLLSPDAPLATYPPQYKPNKPGNYVYLSTSDKGLACVQDSSGKKTTITITKDQGMSVYGKAPWQVSSPDFSKLQVYFQGTRVMPSDMNGKRIQLVEQPIVP